MITLYTWLLIPGFDPFMLTVLKKKRPGELSVSMMDSKSRGPHLRPGQIILLISWARHFTLTIPMPTHKYIIRYQWFEAWQNLCGGRGGYLSWTNYHPQKNKVITNSPELLIWQLHQSCCLLLVVLLILNDTISLFPWRKKYHSGLKKIIISSSDSEAFKLLKRINISKNLYIKFYKINDTTYNNFKIHIFLVCIWGTVHFGRIWLEVKENLFKLHVSTKWTSIKLH